MKERLQKILSGRGIASRRRAEEMISAGRVTVNGAQTVLGDCADPQTDEIRLDGKLLPRQEKMVYLMLNKPRGFVTTLSDEKGRRTAAELVSDCGVRVYPVGRLDMDSEGLLLFTNDGEFANHMMHPSHEIKKTYQVLVSGFTADSLEKLKRPVELDGYKIKIPTVSLLRDSVCGEKASFRITIHEGRNRQVRRMCQLADMKVLRLNRIAEGSLCLGNLPRGRWRYLTESEIAALKK